MHTETSLQLDDSVIVKGRSILRAINNSLRQRILFLIHQKGRMIVTDVYKTLGIEQSVASMHLAILRRANIVNTEREGQMIYYSVNYKRIKDIQNFTEKILK